MPIPTIEWKDGKIKLIDQTQLPRRLVYIYCKDIESVFEAIKSLRVRGAPAIGVAVALGIVLGMKDSKASNYREFDRELNKVINYFKKARPTAINLFWALERMKKVARTNSNQTITKLKEILLKEALKIIEEDKAICRKIAELGSTLLVDGDAVLTHCNAGALATADYGTALGVIYRAKEKGKNVKVYVDETRPMLQGARLTSWELMREKVDVTLICDNMAAQIMKERKVCKVIVGADRVARNGDTANKIGTYNLAILAEFHRIPFYVVAPKSSFDLTLNSGDEIPIEERAKNEVTMKSFGMQIAPEGIKVYNPAFDVTPARFITAIVTEKGILKPPYEKNIARVLLHRE